MVLIRLFELINSSKNFTPQRMNIISIVGEVFRIPSDELNSIEQFVRNTDMEKIQNPAILVLSPGTNLCENCHKMQEGYSGTTIMFLRISSVDLYFTRYFSERTALT